MTDSEMNKLSQFGLTSKRGGVHTKRTMMLKELTNLFEYVPDVSSPTEVYISAIQEDNCLGKRSGVTRKLTADYLCDLYMLDPSILLFRALRYFWQRDPKSRSILALLCTYTRDSVFRFSAPYIIDLEIGNIASKQKLEEYVDEKNPGRFSEIMLQSLVRNMLSSWTQSGHLNGWSKKVRTTATASAGSVAFALLLGYLNGVRGVNLFETEYIKFLDCNYDQAITFAREASMKGWIIFKKIADVIEVSFPNIITDQEREWIHEQN